MVIAGKCKVKPNYFMSEDEVKQLYLYASKHFHPKWSLMILLILGRGLRIGEVCSIHISDISKDFSKLRVVHEKSRILDDLPLLPVLQNALMEYVSLNCCSFKNGWLFCYQNKFGGHMKVKTAVAMMDKIRKGLSKNRPEFLDKYDMNGYTRHRIGWHSLRRFHECQLWEKTKNQVLIASLMRYRDTRTVDTYIVRPFETYKREMDVLQSSLGEQFQNLEQFKDGQTSLKKFMYKSI